MTSSYGEIVERARRLAFVAIVWLVMYGFLGPRSYGIMWIPDAAGRLRLRAVPIGRRALTVNQNG